jgi:hypothetical protein
MSLSEQFCRDRALAAQNEARAAMLTNVRERHLAAELSWNALAAQAKRVSDERDRREAVRLATVGPVNEDWDSPIIED